MRDMLLVILGGVLAVVLSVSLLFLLYLRGTNYFVGRKEPKPPKPEKLPRATARKP
jgi:hypothetical protein